ncbi:hypothetical protein C9374_002352 [Naegleria lovaniensis]|uniref:Uncharacterized protein n=1 Tax=Naegleria lovaniensis TaxID=51637 RepID=A0AA88GV93_NAELO|nr:uncharacterized protein C9374_002352 [Naegleria lovaniensis]KAG2386608.1 hypothetical protein C9374_002352 [Naegleria lovaniensis]
MSLNDSAVMVEAQDEHEYGMKESLYERGRKFLDNREQKLMKERERLESRGENECTFQPTISKKAKKLVREENLYEFNSKWKSKVDQNLEELRAKQAQREEETIFSKPAPLSLVSQFIIMKKMEQKEYSGPISGWEKRFDEFRQKPSGVDDEQYDFSPKINEKSALLAQKHRSEQEAVLDPFERLYEDSKRKKDEDLSWTKKEKRKNNTSEHNTSSNSTDDEKNKTKLAELEFYKKVMERQSEAERKKAKLKEDENDKYSFKPHINRHSLDLAKHIERQPLYSPRKTQEDQSSININDSQNAHKKKFEVESFLQRRLQKEKQRQDKIKQMKHDIDELEMKECTFKPIINPKSLELASLWIESFDKDLEELYEFDPRFNNSGSPKAYLKKHSSNYIDYSISPKHNTSSADRKKAVDSKASLIINSLFDENSVVKDRTPYRRTPTSTSKSTPIKSPGAPSDISPLIHSDSKKEGAITPSTNTKHIDDFDDDELASIENEMQSAIKEFEEWSQFDNLSL